MTNSDRNDKAHAEPEWSSDGDNSTMISLDLLMAALHLISDQHAAERNLHHEQATSDDERIASSSTSHCRSTSVNTIGTSTITTSTLHSSLEVVVADPTAISVHAQDVEIGGFQYVETEGEAKRNDGGAQPSPRWYCVS